MKKRFLLIVGFYFCVSCSENKKMNIEESALDFFCKELLGKEIFFVWDEREEMVLPPLGLHEDFYKDGFLSKRQIFVKRKVNTLSTPIVPDNAGLGKQDSSGLFKHFKRDFELSEDFTPIDLSVDCDDLIIIDRDYELAADNNFVQLEVKRHLSAPENKLVEIVYSIAESDFSIYVLFDKNGKVISW